MTKMAILNFICNVQRQLLLSSLPELAGPGSDDANVNNWQILTQKCEKSQQITVNMGTHDKY